MYAGDDGFVSPSERPADCDSYPVLFQGVPSVHADAPYQFWADVAVSGWLLNDKQTFRDGNLAGSIETFL
jgi:hypothetical protein